MASCGELLSEEQFQCSLCLEVFSSPVSTPCGHSFCRACINSYWESRGACQCPRCGTGFSGRPELCENMFAREMAEKLRLLRLSCSEPHPTSHEKEGSDAPGSVACDICITEKRKAVKSCLVCLTSYCQTHLEPHLRVEALKRHRLLHPIGNLEHRTCQKHQRPLELFCRTDQTCVCVLCAHSDHTSHDSVPVERAWSEKQAQLKKTEAEMQQMMQDRLRKVEEIRQHVEQSRSSTQREMKDSTQVFSTLMHSIETRQAKLTEVMEEKQKAVETRAEGLIKDLEQELTELQNRSTELEKLSQTEDHLYFLQSFPSLCSLPNTKDWSGVRVHTDVCVGMIRRAVEQLEVSITEQEDKLAAMEMEKLHQYSVDVTLDPTTAHPWLAVSSDGRCVKDGDTQQDVPDGLQRYDTAPCVLAHQGCSSGRCYWEVQVGGKVAWDLGVALESVSRKGVVTLAPAYGYWTVCLRSGNEYQACADPPVCLPLRQVPGTVGVFVDYEGGQVSFYNVEARTHIYSFTGCTFTEKLYPYFSPGVNNNGSNAAALIIVSPVNHVGGSAFCEEQQKAEPVKL